jgi:hypothetical protein
LWSSWQVCGRPGKFPGDRSERRSPETRGITANDLDAHRTDPTLSTCCLAAELTRLAESPIVLNRRLREAVALALAGGELSMSEIAMRCGRVKRAGIALLISSILCPRECD